MIGYVKDSCETVFFFGTFLQICHVTFPQIFKLLCMNMTSGKCGTIKRQETITTLVCHKETVLFVFKACLAQTNQTLVRLNPLVCFVWVSFNAFWGHFRRFHTDVTIIHCFIFVKCVFVLLSTVSYRRRCRAYII